MKRVAVIHIAATSQQENVKEFQMASVRQKLKRLEATVQKVDDFVAAGGDLKSPAATSVWMNLMGAFERVAEAFGYEIAKPGRKTEVVKPK